MCAVSIVPILCCTHPMRHRHHLLNSFALLGDKWQTAAVELAHKHMKLTCVLLKGLA